MRELRIKLPKYDNRREDANTIAILADKYNLSYDATVSPILTITDMATDEIVLTSSGVMHCYVSGDENDIEKFLEELKAWFTEF